MEAGSYPGAQLSQRRRRFFQAVLVTRPKASTSDRDRPTARCWPSRGQRALSASGGSAGAPVPGDACPLSPCLRVSALSDHAAQGLRRGAGGAWPYHSNHRRLKGREPSHPVEEGGELGLHGKGKLSGSFTGFHHFQNVFHLNKQHKKCSYVIISLDLPCCPADPQQLRSK